MSLSLASLVSLLIQIEFSCFPLLAMVQIMLFDASRNTLDSRYLKKDEKIESGARITFDGHLVDIGEPRGNNTSFGEINFNVKRENGIIYGQQSCAYRKNTLQKG